MSNIFPYTDIFVFKKCQKCQSVRKSAFLGLNGPSSLLNYELHDTSDTHDTFKRDF